MRVHSSFSVLAAITAVSLASVVHAQPPRVVEIVGNDQMKYSVTSITAKPGETITVRLKSVGTLPKVAMAHNFVLLAKGTDAEAFAKAAAMAAASGYIPPAMKAKVLALTGLAGNGQTVEVTFKAPKQPGRYDYVCTFPGHFFAGMKGVLTVK
jgi:azurin